MKKSILAVAGLAAVAGVVAPMGAAFADNDPLVDQVRVTIDATCTFTGTVNNPRTVTVALGGTGTAAGTPMTVKCNTTGGWNIKAQGVAGLSGDTASTVMTNGNSAEDIETGTSTSGDSSWAFKIEKTDAQNYATIADDYSDFSEIPDSATTIISGTATDLTTGVVVTPTYQVHLSDDQASGTYNGYVKYSFTAGDQS